MEETPLHALKHWYRSYACIMLAGAVLYPFWGYFYLRIGIPLQDPLKHRVIVGIALFIAGSLTLLPPFRRHAGLIYFFAAGGVTLHAYYLVSQNHFEIFLLTSFFLAVTIITGPMTTVTEMALYLALTLFGAIVGPWGETSTNRIVLILLLISHSGSALFNAFERRKMRRQLEADLVAISKRDETEKLLAERLSFLEAQGSDLISIHAPDGTFLHVSNSCVHLLGYQPEELIGKTTYDFLHPDSRSDVRQNHVGTLASMRSTLIAYQFRKKDGSYLWFETASRVRQSVNPELPPEIICVSRDVTDHRKMLAELEAAKKEALESARLKSQFLANMSHEIRTPMNGVIGFSRLLSETRLNKKQRELVQTINTCGEGLLSVISDILDFSKIEAGKLELEEHPFDLRELLSETLSMFQWKTQEKGITFLSKISPGVPEQIIGDRTRLRQILINLLGNATKFTPAGKIFLEVESVTSAKAHSIGLCFHIRDTGIGISDEQMKKLFHSFSQADESMTRKYGGTGLGLVICKNLCELMGGKIWAESEVGKGSTFSFTVAVKVAEGLGERSEDEKFLEATMGKKFPLRVLVAEDNPINQVLTLRLLQSAGYTPALVRNGVEAIQQLESQPYDLLLLDLQMPELDGLETTRRIRASRKLNGKQPYIIAMTASALKEDYDACMAVGMNDYVTKPIALSHFSQALTRCVSRLNPANVAELRKPQKTKRQAQRPRPSRARKSA